MNRILQTASRQAAEAAFRPVALRKAGRAALMLGTALGCSIAILAAPDRALADDECGVPVAGVVTTCAAPTYGTGIRYDSLPGEDLTVVIEEDVAVTGAVTVNGTNAITVQAKAGSTITTTAQYADGIVANSTAGDVSVVSASIETTGEAAYGILVHSYGANATVDSGTVVTSGDNSDGIYAFAQVNLEVTSDSVTTSGSSAYGIDARARGHVTVTSGTITTEGDYAVGINAESLGAGGDVAVTSNIIRTAGNYSDGIYIGYAEDVVVDSTDLSTTGDDSDGIDIHAYGDITITSGVLNTEGYSSRGIDANAGGDLTINSTTLKTKGDSSRGMDADADGDIVITSGILETSGYNSTGIDANADGALTITSTNLITRGEDSRGIKAVADSDLTITSGILETSGNYSTGIDAFASGTATVKSTTLTTEGDYAAGIDVGAYGDISVTSGTISTAGQSSQGLRADTSAGDIIITSGSVTTTGGLSQYDFDYGYENASGIFAEARNGSIKITSGDVTTGIEGQIGAVAGEAGFRATGIRAKADGDVILDSTGTIATWGDDATGIWVSARGAIDIKAKTINTAGLYSMGAFVVGHDDVSIDIGSIRTSGDYGAGVIAFSTNGDVLVKVGSIETMGFAGDAVVAKAYNGGSTTVVVSGEITSAQGRGVHAAGLTVDVTVAAGGSVVGETAGIRADSGLGTTITLAGSVSSTGAYAIDVRGAAATINNTGNTITGAISLTDNADVVNNSGSFFASGVSLFGLGADVFNNSGLLRLEEGTVARTASFSGLETFNNTGAVNLANGIVGDVLDLTGTVFNGQAGSALIVDVSETSSDVLKVGDATGVTTVTINPVGKVGVGQIATFLQSASVETGTEFVLNTKQAGGLIGYDLIFDQASNSFAVTGRASVHALDPLRFVGGAQNLWHKGADGWSSRMNEVRDTASVRPDGLEAWAQVVTGSEELGSGPRAYRAFGDDVTADLSYDQTYVGFSTGFDVRKSGERGSTLWGVTTGLMQSKLDLNSGSSAKYSGLNLGAYAGLTHDALFVNGLIRMDGFKVDAMIPAVPAYESIDGVNWGAKVEAGARFAGGRWFAEPLARLAWVSSDLDGFSVDGGDFDYGREVSLRGELGLRLGAQYQAHAGVSIAPHLGVFAVEEMSGDNEMKLTLGSSTDTLVDQPGGRYGRAELGVTASAPGGLEGFVQGEALFGGDAKGFTARAGVRWRF